MTQVSVLLEKGAVELRRFIDTPDADGFDGAWLERLSQRMMLASTLSDDAMESGVSTIARLLVDSGPLAADATPSFWQVADAFQRKRGRRK